VTCWRFAQPESNSENQSRAGPAGRARLAELNGLLDEMTDLRERIERNRDRRAASHAGPMAVGDPADVDKNWTSEKPQPQFQAYIARLMERERKTHPAFNSLKVKFKFCFVTTLNPASSNLHHGAAKIMSAEADAGQRRAFHHAGVERYRVRRLAGRSSAGLPRASTPV